LNSLQQQHDKINLEYTASKKEIENLNNNLQMLEKKLLEKEKDYEKSVDQINNKNEKIAEKDTKLKSSEKLIEELTRKNVNEDF